MKPQKTSAAISAAGMLLVAGCSGGSLSNGTYHPPVASQANIPANSARVTLTFSIPRRANPVAPQRAKRKSASNATSARTASTQRKPQYISPAVVGGTVTIKIFQNGVSAFPDQTLTVGSTPGSQIFCQSSIYDSAVRKSSVRTPLSGLVCTNTAPVFAPLGSDTFYVEMFDAGQHLLSITPGLPGTSFYGTPPAPVTIGASGNYVSASTYGVVSSVFVSTQTETQCAIYSSTYGSSTNYVYFLDADGFEIQDVFANPITMSLSNSSDFSLVSGSKGGLALPATIYDALSASWIQTSTSGVNTGITVTGAPATQKALYTVDHVGFALSGSNLAAIGFSGTSTSGVPCGNVPLATNAGTPAAFKFTNPVAIVSNDSQPFVAVVDQTSSGPVVDVVDFNEAGFFWNAYSNPILNAVPVNQAALSGAGTGTFEMAVSPNNGKLYVANASGTFSVINTWNLPFGVSYMFGSYGISNPVGIDVSFNGNDTVFMSSGNSPYITEVDNANWSPSTSTFSLQGQPASGYPFTSSVVSSAVLADPFTGQMLFAAFDPNHVGQHSAIVECTPYGPCSGTINGTAVSNTAFVPGALALYNSGLFLAGDNTTAVQLFGEAPPSLMGTWTTTSSAVTRISTSSDYMWGAFLQPGAASAQFITLGGKLSGGSLTGSRAVISAFP